MAHTPTAFKHRGKADTLASAKKLAYWHTIEDDVIEFCDTCAKNDIKC